ncbi:MAG: cupin domain-containing protein [Chthoniobacterales bacterium]
MKKVNLADVAADNRESPGGKYAKTVREISVALGRDADSLDLAKRHPFDLALVHIPPGKSYCPYHSHGAESELYLVVSGCGTVRDKDGTSEVVAGDAFFFGPGEAHQLSNKGTEDFAYYVIADNPRHDSCYYPDSGKWAVTKENADYIFVQGPEVDYYKDEE